MAIEPEVTEHHAGAQQQRTRVGLVLALDIKTDVSATRLEHGHLPAHVASGHDSRAADQSGSDVGHDAAVQVRHHHHVELLRLRHTLHRRIVDDHVRRLEGRELLSHPLDRVPEQTVAELHDVGLVNARHLLPVVGERKGKGKPGDPLALCPGDDLERLDDAGDGLVLEARVLSFGVLTDDTQVHVLVSGLIPGDVLDQDDRGVNVELLTKSDVERLVCRPVDGGVKDS